MEKKEIKRAGCFEGDKADPKALCQMPECRFASECIWKIKEVPQHLGNDAESRGRILQHG